MRGKILKNFSRDKRSGGGRDSGRKSFGDRSSGGRDFGGRGRGGDRERPSMHDAVCDECGNHCQVPFRPTGDKPVYCSDCFEGRGGREERGSRDEGRRSFGGDRERSFGGNKERQMFGATCSGCGNRCEVPFRPTGEKPVYCSDCFEKNKSGGNSSVPDRGSKGGNDGLKEQLNSLHNKLDKILKMLGGDVEIKEIKKEVKELKSEVVVDAKDLAEMKKEAKEMKVVGTKVTEPEKVEKAVKAKKAVAKKPAAKKVTAKKKK